jgi:hypothetical protein
MIGLLEVEELPLRLRQYCVLDLIHELDGTPHVGDLLVLGTLQRYDHFEVRFVRH